MAPKQLSLQSVLDAFKGPVNEEQTWAICYQIMKHVQDKVKQPSTTSDTLRTQSKNGQQQPESNVQFPLIENPSQILIDSNGSVSLDTNNASHGSEKQFISSVGIVLYEALDYGCEENEERNLESSLETFIEKLTCGTVNVPSSDASDGGYGDEGIERDSGDDLTLSSVLTLCTNHLQPLVAVANGNPDNCDQSDLKFDTQQSSSTSQPSISSNGRFMKAEKHYRAVVRAVVSEANDLETFLEQITKGSKQLRKLSSDPLINAALDELCVNDWARLWMQLVKDLRNGVRLKKVTQNDRCTLEYEMTPYEMLLDDIRSQRYQLRHVDVEQIPHEVRKDAHSLILEFIRSRPPLKKVTERVLPPTPVKIECTHDQLMKSIKKEHKLRPTNSLIERPRRQFTSLCNIRESFAEQLRETSQGFSHLNLYDNTTDGMSNERVATDNVSTRNQRNGHLSLGSFTHEQMSPSPNTRRRKLIKADIDLDLVCYSDDEDFDSCVVSRRKSCIPTVSAPPVVTNKNNCERRRSFRNLFGFGQSIWNFKSNS